MSQIHATGNGRAEKKKLQHMLGFTPLDCFNFTLTDTSYKHTSTCRAGKGKATTRTSLLDFTYLLTHPN